MTDAARRKRPRGTGFMNVFQGAEQRPLKCTYFSSPEPATMSPLMTKEVFADVVEDVEVGDYHGHPPLRWPGVITGSSHEGGCESRG